MGEVVAAGASDEPTAPGVVEPAHAAPDQVEPVAWPALLGTAGLVVVALAVTAGRYGYHRDELYFIAAGAHPALGYPDQPPLTPLLAWAMNALVPQSLTVLRIPAMVAGALTTIATGLMAREFGGRARAQWLAAACWGVGAVCLVTGHFLSTTTGDVCATAIASLCVVRLLRTGDLRWWAPAGFVVGVGLLNKSWIAVVLALVLLSLAVLGPRDALRSRWLLVGLGLAVLGSLPYAIWQLEHGVPQLALAHSIASQGNEGGRGGVIPFQLVLIGPLLSPVWIAGLVVLLRSPELRAYRCFAIAYLVMIPLLIVTGGKAYYQAGFYPLLLAAGAGPTDRWMGRHAARIAAVAAAVAVTAVISALIGLALRPEHDLQGSLVIAVNPDAGEMVGWPRFTHTIAAVYHALPAAERRHATIFASNYGEAGAIALLGPARGLPYPYSGHNGWWFWGPPPNADTTVVVVGFDRPTAARYFVGCEVKATINDGVGLDNKEQGNLVMVCPGERRPWSQLWLSLRHYD